MTSDDQPDTATRSIETLRRFRTSQDGAVTVDWVALTAFTILLGMGAAFYVATSVPSVAGKVGDHLEATTVVPEG